MNDLELINKINSLSFENKENELIDLLNELLASDNYKKNIENIFILISLTEMYGFLSYLNDDEKKQFMLWDEIRSESYKGIDIQFYNKGQLSLLYELEKNKKVFFSAPTSFGKTSMLIEYLLENFNKIKNVLFIIPTNSLLEELYQKLLKLNKKYEMSYSITTQPQMYNSEKNLLLLTPERFFLVLESINVGKFDLIVMDETYQIVDSKNNSISDFLNSRSLRFRKVADIIGASNNRVVFLSPFTYELSESMRAFLERFNIKKIDRKIEYVKRKVYDVSTAKKISTIFNIKIFGCTTLVEKTNALLNILYKQKNIVYVASYTKAYEIVDELQWRRDVITDDNRFNAFIRHLEQNFDADIHYEWKIITALKKGVGIYFSPLPRYIKKEIINLYERNIIGTLIVTTAFTEGVNTNASNLIFTSLVDGPKTNKLSDIDVLNVSGRAGRFTQNCIGNIYCLDKKIYEKVLELQNSASIKLENYNYKKSTEKRKNDYEIDMIDDQYLSEDEKNEKNEYQLLAENLNLNNKDLFISLNVSLKWKLIVYKYLKEKANLEEIYQACIDILNEENGRRIKALETIFIFLKYAFKDENIDAFPTESYEIKAFDKKGQLIWGRLYKIYCAGKIKNIIRNNIIYITSEFRQIMNSISTDAKCKDDVSKYFYKELKGWILNYYDSNLNIKYDAFYTETFKFISNIVQYKIPFYVSFVISMVKLYINKNNLMQKFDSTKLDSKRTVMLFEDGTNNEEYNSLIDYGVSNDLIIKISEAKISYDDLVNFNFNKTIFDEYEIMVINDFVKIIKS